MPKVSTATKLGSEFTQEDQQAAVKKDNQTFTALGLKVNQLDSIRRDLACAGVSDPDELRNKAGTIVLRGMTASSIVGESSSDRSFFVKIGDALSFSGIKNGVQAIFANAHPLSSESITQNSKVLFAQDPLADSTSPGGMTLDTAALVFSNNALNHDRIGKAISISNEATHRLLNSQTTIVDGKLYRNIYYFPNVGIDGNDSVPADLSNALKRRMPALLSEGVSLRSKKHLHEIISDAASVNTHSSDVKRIVHNAIAEKSKDSDGGYDSSNNFARNQLQHFLEKDLEHSSGARKNEVSKAIEVLKRNKGNDNFVATDEERQLIEKLLDKNCCQFISEQYKTFGRTFSGLLVEYNCRRP